MDHTSTWQLRQEVAEFERWANSNFPDERLGEWELDYPGWDKLYKPAIDILRSDVDWTAEEIGLLIFVIARDNEIELIADEVPAVKLVSLARSALGSKETDAKWQLAIRLTKLPWSAEIEQTLLGFAKDSDEYVRRRALLTLADCKSEHTEQLAEIAWRSGDEYQRIAALHALYKISSPLLLGYLQLADKDGRQFVVKNAQDIRTHRGEYPGGLGDFRLQ